MIDNSTAPEFVIKAPFMTELLTEIRKLRDELDSIKAKLNPQQELYTLAEACALKGISAGTLSNKAYQHLKPNGGKPDKIVCNRERWHWETIQKWLRQSDEELLELSRKVK
jgi:hypothetical protein